MIHLNKIIMNHQNLIFNSKIYEIIIPIPFLKDLLLFLFPN